VGLVPREQCAGAVFVSRIGRDRNGGEALRTEIQLAAHATNEFVTVHVRHADVADEDVEIVRGRTQQVQCCGPGCHGGDVSTLVFEHLPQRFEHGPLVFHRQHPLAVETL